MGVVSESPRTYVRGLYIKRMTAPLPLAEELTPAPDPWAVARRLAGLPHLLFLDSADRHPDRGRYSFVTADPADWLIETLRYPKSPTPFVDLARRIATFPLPTRPGLPPFQGGLAGLFGYGLQHAVERVGRPRFDEFGVPDLAVGLYDWVIAWDHAVNRAWVVSTGYPETGRKGRERAARRLDQVRAWLNSRPHAERAELPHAERAVYSEDLAPQYRLPGRAGVTSNFDRDGYLAAVRRAVEYVHAAVRSQANIPRGPLAGLPGPPWGRTPGPGAATRPPLPDSPARASSPSPARRPSGSCASPTARSRPGRSRGPGRGARHRTKSASGSPTWSPRRRTGPKT